MPPPPPAASSSSKNPQAQQKKLRSEFLCKIRYQNTLPPLPFPPKLLPYPTDRRKYTAYRTAEWMKRIPHPLVTEVDLGMQLDLVDMRAYDLPAEPIELEEADLALLYHPDDEQDKKTPSSRPRPLVPWLRRTEYISSEGSKVIGRKKENIEAKRLQQELERAPEIFDRSRDAQLAAVEHTFEQAASYSPQMLRHPTKPDVRAVEVIPIYPDKNVWSNMYALCVFDDDPRQSRPTDNQSSKEAVASQELGILKTIQDESGENFMAYYMPHRNQIDSINRQRTADSSAMDTEEKYEFDLVRNFNFRKEDEDRLEKVVFVLDQEKASYISVSARILLHKRRGNKNRTRRDGVVAAPAGIDLSFRQPTEDEQTADTESVAEIQ